MKIPEMLLGNKKPTDWVSLKKDGVTRAIISYNLEEILDLIQKEQVKGEDNTTHLYHIEADWRKVEFECLGLR